ncbi:MAG: thiamine phosphate synthase [Bacteroidaceae bacterium]|nr:thiamine phosphate synthase [Bacteroidaceae bacterium]
MVIVITLPDCFKGEAEAITRLFAERGIDRLHIRKPEASADVVAQLVESIPPTLYDRISIHDHFDIAQRYGLSGIHLTHRHPEAPSDWEGILSTSAHSIEELRRLRAKNRFDYLSLSPIFDSISKHGYHAAFTRQQLAEAHAAGDIDSEVLALGGVSFDRLPQVAAMGFGGGMILGDAWR